MSDENSNTPVAAVAAEPASVAPVVDIEVLKAEHAAEMAALKSEVEALRLQKAVRTVKNAEPVALGNGTQDFKRAQIIRACGGVAAFYSMTPEARASVQGVNAEVPDAEIKKYFGKTSKGVDAQRLTKENPNRYRMLRILAKEKGIL